MTSLREEIKEIVGATRYEWKKEIIKKQTRSVDEYTDDIISIFEKHVASLKKGELYRAYNAALEDLEEILKK